MKEYNSIVEWSQAKKAERRQTNREQHSISKKIYFISD